VDWIFEIKQDGYRAITVFDQGGKPGLRESLTGEQKSRAFGLF
jgi:hypothetical protein